MGCMLSAAACNKWLMEDILNTSDYDSEQRAIPDESLGRNRVFFLPYLMGERSPINDTNARGTFIGMTMDTTRADLIQAVLEGVAFAVRDSVEEARKTGIQICASKICGGGARSERWKKILANVLNLPLYSMETEQGPAMGSAMLAMAACGGAGLEEICSRCTHITGTVEPDPMLAEAYEKRYQQFVRIYPACKKLFTELAEEIDR